MPRDLAGLRHDRAKASSRMTELAAATRGRSMTDDEQREFDAAAGKVTDLDREISAAEAEAERSTSSASTRADAAEIAKLCVNGGVASMASALIAEGVSVDEARTRINAAGEMKAVVEHARRVDPTIPADAADKLLAEGKTVEQARASFFERFVAAEEKTSIRSHVPAAQGNAGLTASASSMERELRRAGLKKDA